MTPKCIAIGLIIIIASTLSAVAESGTPGNVTIYRDEWGTPHIYSDREESGFYGLGYAQAEDRLEDLLIAYLAARGELAANFGSDHVESDLTALRYRHLEEARAGFARLNPQLQRNYRHFIAGIERYMRKHANRVPSWAPPLEPALPIASMRHLLWHRTIFDALVGWRARGSPKAKCDLEQLAVVSDSIDVGEARQSFGSNEWVLMPWRTADGAVIHVSDPHGGFGRAYEFRIDAGPVKAAASNFSSMALPFIGHTRHVAWAFTLGGPDVSDCYEIIVDSRNPRRFRFDGEWRYMATRKVVVRVKGGEPVTSVFEYTKHNGVLSPVVERRGNRAYVVSIPMMHEAGLLDEEFYRMALAKGMDEFRRAIDPGLFAVNLMAGSADGNTMYVRAGRVPIRPSGFDWTRPVPGNTAESAWRGLHPFEDLIRVENPALGYMHNTNVAPDRMISSGAPRANDYPAYLFNDLPGRTNSRGLRAIQMLESSFNLTVEDALELALDEKWIDTTAWQYALRTALNSNPGLVRKKSRDFRSVAQRILGFDGFANKDSVAALNYYYWRTSLNALPDATRDEIFALSQSISTGANTSDLQNSLLIAALDQALDRMVKLHGGVDIKYGDVFRAGRGGTSWPLGGGGIPGVVTTQGGAFINDRTTSTMRAWGFTDPDENGKRWVSSGQYHTTLTIFTDPIRSFSALPLGQSGDPRSPYYSNQAQLISERRLKPTYFYKEDLLKHVVSEITLQVPSVQ